MVAAFLRFVAVALACIAMAAAAQDKPAPKPTRILFIGNSLTFWTKLPDRIAAVARATGRPCEVEMVALPSFSLEDHWNDGRAMGAIRGGRKWDWVVLQQGTSAHEEGRAQLIEYSKKYAEQIRAVGAKPAIYMTWPLSDRPKDFPAAIQSHRLAAEATGALLLPAGEAWMRVLSKAPRTKLYGDAIHPSSIGSDLTALTLYFALFPAGPQEFTEEYVTKIAKALDMNPDTRDLFVDAATRAIDEPIAIR